MSLDLSCLRLEEVEAWPESSVNYSDKRGKIYRTLPNKPDYIRLVDVFTNVLGGNPERLKHYAHGTLPAAPALNLGHEDDILNVNHALRHGLIGKIAIHRGFIIKFVRRVEAYRASQGGFASPVFMYQLQNGPGIRVAHAATEADSEISYRYLLASGFEFPVPDLGSMAMVREFEDLNEVMARE